MDSSLPIRGLPPILDGQTKCLVLGTIPGAESLKRKEYYANPRNQFWRITEALFGINHTSTYSERKRELLGRGIGLWDVLESCDRLGSADGKIRNPKINCLDTFLDTHSSIKAVFFNGKRPRRLVKSLMSRPLDEKRYGLVVLPSSSSSNTRYSLTEKVEIWKVLKQCH